MRAPTNAAANIGAASPLFHVTFFPDKQAFRLETKDLPIWALRDLVLTTSADKKEDLPLLKLAKFGDKRSDKNCLRSNENVLAISGIEFDYDGEVVSFDDALALIRQARLTALLYTSSSYTAAKPRWRALLPASRDLPPEDRSRLVARINGVLGGIASGESFTLSQPHHFGKISRNPHHRCEYTIGEFIDMRGDLDERAISKDPPKSAIRNPTLTDVPGVEPAIPITSLDDDRLNLPDVVRFMIENAAPPDDAPEKLRRLNGGRGHCFVVGQLVDGGLSNAQIKEVYRLGRIANGPREHARGFDGYVERVIAYCRSTAVSDDDLYDIAHADVGQIIAGWTTQAPEQSQAEAANSDQIKTEASAADTKAKEAPKPSINATPFEWVVPGMIPLRRWVYRPHYIRKFASLTVSTGGVGKSSQLIVEALAMASGKPLLDIHPEKKLRVWYWNGEDPMDELQRRFAAAVKHYELKPEDIDDRLFVDSGRVMQIVIAVELKRAPIIAMPVIKQVIATLLENEIDVLMIDPFVSCHRVNENDNAAIERVAKSWSYIAEETNCSVMLAHHSRKTGGGEGVTVDDGRGASALLAAVRSARTLNNMSVREAENAEIDERERRSYFRADIGKANLTPPAEEAEWFKLLSINLENGDGDAFWCGDHVGVVTAWKYPKATAPTITASDIKRAQDAIKAGGPWREDQRSVKEPWVGIPIAQALGLYLDRKKDKRTVVGLVSTWLTAGWLKRDDGIDAGRKPRTYIVAGKAPADEAPKPDDIPF